MEIWFEHSYSRAHRVPTYQISPSYDFSPKNGFRTHKKGPRPKIKILKSGSGFRSPRGPTYIPTFMILRSRRSEWTNKQTLENENVYNYISKYECNT